MCLVELVQTSLDHVLSVIQPPRQPFDHLRRGGVERGVVDETRGTVHAPAQTEIHDQIVRAVQDEDGVGDNAPFMDRNCLRLGTGEPIQNPAVHLAIRLFQTFLQQVQDQFVWHQVPFRHDLLRHVPQLGIRLHFRAEEVSDGDVDSTVPLRDEWGDCTLASGGLAKEDDLQADLPHVAFGHMNSFSALSGGTVFELEVSHCTAGCDITIVNILRADGSHSHGLESRRTSKTLAPHGYHCCHREQEGPQPHIKRCRGLLVAGGKVASMLRTTIRLEGWL
mmetsp:Transcript_23991/g.43230  ORF Transcript_23991/g.43230 Transcript_23991/m.43230 type:complete len:279 (+) Transcript_23991:3254-4090(+)